MASKLRFSFVATVSTVALSSAACGSEVTVMSGAGGNGSTGTTSTTASASSGGASTTSTTASSSTGQTDNCPDELPYIYDECTINPDEICTYDVACQSGNETVSVYCENGGWTTVANQDCSEYPGNSCPGTDLYCSGGEWVRPLSTNPPSPCPSSLPMDGAECFSGGFGGTWDLCGYRCGNDGWVVANCAFEPGSVWELDECIE